MARNWLTVALAAALFGSGAAVAQKIDIESLARAPAVTGVSMSDEGDTLIAIIADPKNPDRRALASWDLGNVDGTKPLQVGFVTPSNDKMGFVAAGALKAGKVLAVASQPWVGQYGCGEGASVGNTKTYVYKLFLTDRTIKDFADPYAGGRALGVSQETQRCLELGTNPQFIDLPLDPENVIVKHIDFTDLTARYSKLNLKTGRTTPLYKDTGDRAIGLIDPRDGAVRTKLRIDPKGNLQYDQQTFILNPQTGDFDLEEPLTVDFRNRNTMDVTGYDEETGKYFVLTDKFSDHVAAYLYDARTNTFDDKPLFAHEEFDVSGVILGRNKSDFGKILGFTYDGGYRQTYWTDPGMKSIQDGLEALGNFKGQHVEILSVTDDRSKVLFMTESAKNPPAYYLMVNKRLLGVGSERPWLKPEQVGDQSLVYYSARDGLKVPAILTLPAGWKKGDPAPPAIVLPHGGPWARDFQGWDIAGWTGYFSSRGITVLQPQYRGSAGWGHNLWLAGDREWGLKMQDDKDDGAAWLVQQGYANKDRIAIFGYSYGGFAAFAASVRPGGPFKCAIAGAGVANLTRIGNNWGENRQQRAYQGWTVKGMDPQQNVDKLSIPILIYHGDHDVRVPLYHSVDFYNAVKSTGKAKLVVLKDMGHQIDKWTADNHRDSLKAIDDFLTNDCKL